jgi:hypothetical protein
MRRTAVPGHALRSEGKAYMPGEEEPWLRIRGHIGRGVCECGTASAVQWSDAARKRWHAEHKQAVREQLT